MAPERVGSPASVAKGPRTRFFFTRSRNQRAWASFYVRRRSTPPAHGATAARAGSPRSGPHCVHSALQAHEMAREAAVLCPHVQHPARFLAGFRRDLLTVVGGEPINP